MLIITFWIALPTFIILVVLVVRDNRARRSALAFEVVFHDPEVSGFARIHPRYRNGWRSMDGIESISFGDAQNPEHEDLAITIRLISTGGKYVIVGEKWVHTLDLATAELILNEDARIAFAKGKTRRSRHHDAIFNPIIAEAFGEEQAKSRKWL